MLDDTHAEHETPTPAEPEPPVGAERDVHPGEQSEEAAKCEGVDRGNPSMGAARSEGNADDSRKSSVSDEKS